MGRRCRLSVDLESTHRQLGLNRFVQVAIALTVTVPIALYIFAGHTGNNAADTNRSIRVSGNPSDLSTATADLMGLSPLPGEEAPQIRLTDQHGRATFLSMFRGQTVVLTFMDPHCVDICPLVSQEFVDAYENLGPAASHVIFVAVNVNPYFTSTSAVSMFSASHGLDAIPNWRFLTGSRTQLSSIWRQYGVFVQSSSATTDVVHSALIFFINSHGREMFLANPTNDHTTTGHAYLPGGQLSSWGEGIAGVASSVVKQDQLAR